LSVTIRKMLLLGFGAQTLQNDGTAINGVTTMSIPDGLRAVIEQHRAATNEFIRGNVGPWQDHCSHANDVTIIGGWGGFEKGWAEQVEKRYEWAANRFKGAEGKIDIENVSLVVTGEMAYSVDIERSHVRLAGTDRVSPMALRVTTIYRAEDGGWKMVHRHADPLLNAQGPESVLQK
jgi:ketosteroid isomerase-like protein